MRKLAFLCAFLFLAVPSGARTITVDDDGPADFNNIQAAIGDANDFDTVAVADGIYTGSGNRDIDFLGKSITVRSENGPNNCVIDCNGEPNDNHCGFILQNNEGPNSLIDGFTITNGYADNGGGIRCIYSSPTIIRCTIIDNTATLGGGICSGNTDWTNYGSPKILSCTIVRNTASEFGGGIFFGGDTYSYSDPKGEPELAEISYPKVKNCTFSGNYAATRGGGVCSQGACDITMENSIFWDDAANTDNEIGIRLVVDADNPTITVSHSDVAGGLDGIDIFYYVNWGSGNIDADPSFSDPCSDDYHLACDSVCINTGDPNYTPGPNETDIDGETRVINSRLDMGADELNYEGPLIETSPTEFEFYADVNGSNPATQSLSIRNKGTGVLDWEVLEDCNWLNTDPNAGSSTGEIDDVNLYIDTSGLSAGIYSCTLTVSADASVCDSNAAVILYLRSEDGQLHVPSQYETIQGAIETSKNGDDVIIAPGTHTGTGNRDLDFGGKAITVCSTDPEDPCVVAATIIDCNGSESEPHRGFYFHNSEGRSSVVDGLTIINGYAGSGGGIFCARWDSNVTIRNCTFRNNTASSGGGVSSDRSDPIFHKCKFINNTTTYGGGGGLYIKSGDVSLTNCVFKDNVANRYRGGGLRVADGDITLENCIFTGNSAGDGGGGVGVNGAHPVANLRNCTFSENTSDDRGGGIDVGHLSTQILSNCIFWNNSDSNGTGELSQIGPEALSRNINYSCIQGWTGSLGGMGNIGDDPCFADPCGQDYHLLLNSACIDTGDPCYAVGPSETDLDGRDRVVDGDCNTTDIVDMGAYEFNWVYIGDVAGGCDVDLIDFSVFALTWLLEDGKQGYDPNCDISLPVDGIIDERDLDVFTDNWLEGL